MVFLDGKVLLTYCIDSINKNKAKFKLDLEKKGFNGYFAMQVYGIITKKVEYLKLDIYKLNKSDKNIIINALYHKITYKPYFDNLAKLVNSCIRS